MSEGHLEAKLYALRKSKDGVIVSFVCHPSDITSDLMNLDIGARLMVGWSEIDDRELPSAEDVCGILAPDNRAAQGGISAKVAAQAETPRETEEMKDAKNAARAAKRRAFKDLSYPEQAGILCEDATFQEFVRVRYHSSPASDFVRSHCGVTSRAELSTNHDALNRWRKLEAEYQNYLADERYSESIHR